MASPSTSTLRSGTIEGSRFSGAGALEKSSTALWCLLLEWREKIAAEPAAATAEPATARGTDAGGRGGPPKLKNCADAGPTIPTNSAIATASAISGPLSVNTRVERTCAGTCGSVAMDRQAIAIIAESGRKRAAFLP